MGNSKYSADELTVLSYFFTNIEGDVYFLKNFPDFEVAALFVASYSRNKKPLRDMFLDSILDIDALPEFNKTVSGGEQVQSASKFRQQHSELVARCFGKWAGKIREASTQASDLTGLLGGRARELFGIWADKYGHDSLKDMAHGLGFACENTSIILSKMIEDHPLGDYQEKSTRYLEFQEFAVLLPKEFDVGGWRDKLAENTELVMSAYKELVKATIQYLLKARQKPADINENAWLSAVTAEAFDNARYVLPARLITNLGQISNARTLQSQLVDLLASPLAEAREKAQQILAEARKVMPVLMLNVPVNTYLQQTAEDMRKLATTGLEEKIETRRPVESNSAKLVYCTPDLENKIIASMLYEFLPAGKSWEATYTAVQKMQAEEKEKIVKIFFEKREQQVSRVDAMSGNTETKTHRFPPMKALQNGHMMFEIIMDYGAFRDVHRHRRCSQRRQLLSADLGYEVPRLIAEMGGNAEKIYRKAMDASKKLFDEARASQQFHPAALQYLVNLGFRISETKTFDVEQLRYELELRTTPQGHFSYRKIYWEMYEQARSVLPIICKYFKVDTKEYEVGRLKQEQRHFEKVGSEKAIAAG